MTYTTKPVKIRVRRGHRFLAGGILVVELGFPSSEVLGTLDWRDADGDDPSEVQFVMDLLEKQP